MMIFGRSKTSRSRGHTILELLLVLTIIGILAALSFPRVHNWYVTTRKDHCLQGVADQLRNLRATAIRQSVQIEIVEAESNGLHVYSVVPALSDPRLFTEESESIRQEQKRRIKVLSCQQDLRFGPLTTVIKIYPNGTCKPGTILAVADNDTHPHRLSVSRLGNFIVEEKSERR